MPLHNCIVLKFEIGSAFSEMQKIMAIMKELLIRTTYSIGIAIAFTFQTK